MECHVDINTYFISVTCTPILHYVCSQNLCLNTKSVVRLIVLVFLCYLLLCLFKSVSARTSYVLLADFYIPLSMHNELNWGALDMSQK